MGTERTIRIWHGCKVVLLLAVDQTGGYSTMGAVGGADNSTKADIEIDPWAGMIVEHATGNPPVGYRETGD